MQAWPRSASGGRKGMLFPRTERCMQRCVLGTMRYAGAREFLVYLGDVLTVRSECVHSFHVMEAQQQIDTSRRICPAAGAGRPGRSSFAWLDGSGPSRTNTP